ncbi:MAG: ABC transporter permease subunit [Dehalococcoidia bacterium]
MLGFDLDVAGFINPIINFLREILGGPLRVFSNVIETVFEIAVDAILMAPPILVIAVLGLLLWRTGGWRLGLGSAVALAVIGFMGLWPTAVDTIVLVLLATLAALAVAIPIGVLMGISDRAALVIRPVLDLMQTMPAFVYLLPAVMFFSVGKVPAIVATMIWAMPPPVRLTNLGVRGVPSEIHEAADSFGTTRWQLLYKVQIPLAMPSIMAGINQCIMMALSMAVITAMIGGGGLGGVVLRGLGTLDIGQAFEAGISIVFLAVIMDRTAASLNRRSEARTRGAAGPAAAGQKAAA